MALKVCIHGVKSFSGLVTFGGRMRPSVEGEEFDIEIYLSGVDNDNQDFITTTSDAIIEPFLACYLSNPDHRVRSVSYRAQPQHESDVAQMLRRIPRKFGLALVPEATNTGPPPANDLLRAAKTAGNTLLTVPPGSSRNEIESSFAGYAKAADLYMSAIRLMKGIPREGISSTLVLQCLSNLLFTCDKIQAVEVGAGILEEGFASSCVRDETIERELRARCLYRAAVIREKAEEPAKAYDTALASWHLQPKEKSIQNLIQRLQPTAVQQVVAVQQGGHISDECVFCMEYIRGGQSFEQRVTALQCGHNFHTGCIEPWVRFWGEGCPFCRSPVA